MVNLDQLTRKARSWTKGGALTQFPHLDEPEGRSQRYERPHYALRAPLDPRARIYSQSTPLLGHCGSDRGVIKQLCVLHECISATQWHSSRLCGRYNTASTMLPFPRQKVIIDTNGVCQSFFDH